MFENIKKYFPASFNGLPPVMVESKNGEYVRISDFFETLQKKDEDNKKSFCCYGCIYLCNRTCVLDVGNHCIRRAEDYFKPII